MRVYYKCTLYEDLDTTTIPVGKAKDIAIKLDGIGIATFEIIIPEQGQPPEPQPEPQQTPPEGYS